LENALDGSGGLASNYQLPSLDAVNAPVSISVKAVGLSASKIYDAGVDLTGYVTISTGVGSETLNYSGATASSKDVAVSNKYIHTITLVDATNGSGGLASNYKLPSLDAENAPVTITEKTVGLLANRIYDGTRNLSGPDVSITTGVEGETLSYSGATVSSKDVAVAGKHIDAITLENALDGSGGVASNYQLPSLDAVNALVSITPKVVELSASKIYDALLTLTGSDVTIITGVGEETLSYSGATASAKDVVATGNYIDSIILEDAIDQSGGLAGNYLLPSLKVSNAPVNIDPAPLDIQALGEVKTYGREALLDGNLFDVSGLLGQEEIFSVSLQSDGSGRNAALGLYDIVPSDASGPGFDPNNYFIDYLKSLIFLVTVIQNKAFKNAFCSVRPPGHHCNKNKAAGFCILNNIAIGAKYLLKRHKYKRIAIVDFDVHHGNGTQDIFYNNKNVLFISTHQYPFYPGTGSEKEKGKFDNICNIPLPAGTNSEEYLNAFEFALKRLREFKPEFVLISAGFDGHAADPLAQFKLTTEDYYEITKRILESSKKFCNGKIVSILEGGYDLQALKDSTKRHVDALLEFN